jgi:hypothetical protein
MATGFPHAVQGRVSDETHAQIAAACERFKATEGALVRAALEDYRPRFIANAGRPKYSELFAKLALVIDEKPETESELEKFARQAARSSRRRAAAA